MRDTVTKTIDEVRNKICSDYCKYQDRFDRTNFGDDEDRALSYINFLTHYCNNCPMSNL